jgi:hypothetical protein
MKATLSLLNRRLIVTSESPDIKQLFRELGQLGEVFECDSACGCCGSVEIRPSWRSIEDYEYFSLRCTACGAELSLGQRKDGGLYARRKDNEGRPVPNNGWHQYQQRALEAPPIAQQSATTPRPVR